MSDANSREVEPLASAIQYGEDGNPYLQGFQCSSCREVVVDLRRGCPKCAAVGSLVPVRLSDHGTLFSFTIVHRSFPQIKTPFVSVVVQLDGGGYIKGNLEEVEPIPEKISFNMLLRVRFERLQGVAPDGPTLLRYYFIPAGGLP